MINLALETLNLELETYIESSLGLVNSQRASTLTPILDKDGVLIIPLNSLGFTLVNIEEERVMKSQATIMRALNGRVSHVNPEIKLNLYVLISAHFENYSTGLMYLSGAVRFFQSKNVFTPRDTPALPPKIEKLYVDLHDLNFEQMNNLWGALGAKYLPSVMYKVRLVIIQESQVQDDQPPITTVNLTGKGI